MDLDFDIRTLSWTSDLTLNILNLDLPFGPECRVWICIWSWILMLDLGFGNGHGSWTWTLTCYVVDWMTLFSNSGPGPWTWNLRLGPGSWTWPLDLKLVLGHRLGPWTWTSNLNCGTLFVCDVGPVLRLGFLELLLELQPLTWDFDVMSSPQTYTRTWPWTWNVDLNQNPRPRLGDLGLRLEPYFGTQLVLDIELRHGIDLDLGAYLWLWLRHLTLVTELGLRALVSVSLVGVNPPP